MKPTVITRHNEECAVILYEESSPSRPHKPRRCQNGGPTHQKLMEAWLESTYRVWLAANPKPACNCGLDHLRALLEANGYEN